MITSPMPRTWAYALAVGLVGLALAVKSLVVDPGMGRPTTAVIMLVWPVTLAARFGGRGPGLVATVLAAIGAAELLEPVGSIRIALVDDQIKVLGLVGEGVLISWCMGQLHAVRAHTETVAERAAIRIVELMAEVRAMKDAERRRRRCLIGHDGVTALED